MADNRYGLYTLFVPSQAVDASKVYFDLFNGSERNLTVSSVKAIKDGSSAVTGALAVHLLLTRTTAVGTGGTAATEEGASLTAATITKLEQRALPDGVDARLAPTGGATAGAVVAQRQLFPEETTGVNYEGLEFLEGKLTVPPGTGIRVVQGLVASVGNVGFGVTFY